MMTATAGGTTRQEIISQAKVWKETLQDLERNGFDLPVVPPQGRGLFVGAGSSLYLSRTLAHLMRSLTGVPVLAVPPSDLLICAEDYNHPEPAWVLGVSRSGTTTETVRALQFQREQFNSVTWALTCHPEAEMAQAAQVALAFDRAAEKSVVMTRSFTTMLLGFSRWIFHVARRKDLFDAQKRLPEALDTLGSKIERDVHAVVTEYRPQRIVTFGQGAYYGLACEIALKVKEMAIQQSEPFHSLEYRHGPKSIADADTLVVALLSDGGEDYERNLLSDVKKLGAKIWAITGSAKGITDDHANLVTEIGTEIPEKSRLPLVMPVAQLFGLEYALSRGEDPDSPKNLTQVVTL
jgi:glucosamine--fructose-6-phosphate aminotransferase (isomerizing)